VKRKIMQQIVIDVDGAAAKKWRDIKGVYFIKNF
jgi:hypothetical protein